MQGVSQGKPHFMPAWCIRTNHLRKQYTVGGFNPFVCSSNCRNACAAHRNVYSVTHTTWMPECDRCFCVVHAIGSLKHGSLTISTDGMSKISSLSSGQHTGCACTSTLYSFSCSTESHTTAANAQHIELCKVTGPHWVQHYDQHHSLPMYFHATQLPPDEQAVEAHA